MDSMSTRRDDLRSYYVCDPHDPARAGQTMQRWRVRDATLTIEHGQFGSWRAAASEQFASPAHAQETLTSRLDDAHARGLVVESDPLAVVRRLSAENPTLVAALQAVDDLGSPQARAQLQVYADFLQLKGDPRGTLAALQLRDGEADAASAWLTQHATHIFGPLANALGPRRELELTWTGGWITSLSLGQLPPDPDDPCSSHALEALLQLPACACLRSLETRGLELNTLGKLELGPCRASLRSLVINVASAPHLELGSLPMLERLELRGDLCGQVVALKLRELSFSRAALSSVSEFLEHSALGPIHSLALGFSPDHADSRECTSFRELLDHQALAELRELTLFGTGLGYHDHIGYFDDRWIDALLSAPVLARLERRDFSRLLMRPEAQQRLREACAALPGETRV